VIADGAVSAGAELGRDFEIDIDRASAIRSLIARARPGDTILLAGKGHERRMLVKDERRPWNDREETEHALAEAGYRGIA
jgi:UDP-N-acetylmuramoyl-L-alanyl-D-glutamate--2,6-diaminopimelate ligase